ncbi:MAG: carbamoyltransferase HypF [Chloroflexota bacterium]|nr:carbamoyltransferase HypF [Chloroflexota bacterium]
MNPGKPLLRVETMKAAGVKVRGVVQGVGFRPFVYRLARELDVRGWVRNTSGDVEIAVEGNVGSVDAFVAALRSKAPPQARVEDIDVLQSTPRGYATFDILDSLSREGRYLLVSPDIATCDDCRREIFDSSDRRYRYPFTNCTNCGPRFTIIEDIPYDRVNTTMREFRMCADCQREYEDPLDRRFHAQPNACADCGPQLSLVDSVGDVVACDDSVAASAGFLREGKILAIRGLGGFQLACDATNEEAVNTLRERKRRPSKPFAVMVSLMDDFEKHCIVSTAERDLLLSPESPIVLVEWRRSESTIAPAVAPRLNYMGVMLPYTPLHHLLMNEVDVPLVMTSGNISEEPIAKDNDEALRRLGGIADYFLLHSRDIYARYDDSVCMVERSPQVVRRARGYAPYPIALGFDSRQILACGAGLKNTFCLTKGRHAFVSQHIGDMENAETLEHFEGSIDLYKKLFRIEPEAIAHDMHPEYLATKYALRTGEASVLRLVPVQHHHAHIVSCMADNGVSESVIGVALDGTGYGADGAIWGGEFLLADLKGFERRGHIEYVPLLGGEAAIKKPYRMALSYVWTLLGEDFSLDGLPLSDIDPSTIDLLKQQLRRGLNCPPTSSAGRLFDAVSAIAGVRGEVDYEAQAVIEMEMLASDVAGDIGRERYPIAIAERDGLLVVGLRDTIAAVVDDVRSRVAVADISFKFHDTAAHVVCQMCKLISDDSGVNRVALSGGVFQNRLLLRLVGRALEAEGFEVFTHRAVPCNDGGVSLGQAVVANFALSS